MLGNLTNLAYRQTGQVNQNTDTSRLILLVGDYAWALSLFVKKFFKLTSNLDRAGMYEMLTTCLSFVENSFPAFLGWPSD